MQKTIYFAGGCFWGVQAYFDLLPGVLSTRVGYANSNVLNPTYELVCRGITGAVEALEVIYDDTLNELIAVNRENNLSFLPDCLLSRFFSIIDPTALNYQGNDRGTQYRSGIYVLDATQIEQITTFIEDFVAPRYAQEIATEVLELQNFYEAESYHQKYLLKNPHGYCHIDVSKALQPLKIR